MTNYIAIFLEEFVMFPNETRTIHSTNLSFIALVKDCKENNKSFGLIWNKAKSEFGTVVNIIETSDVDKDEITVTIKGVEVFKILENITEIPDKSYVGAIVNYPENTFLKISPNLEMLINKEVFEKYKELQETENVDYSLTSYKLAILIGMNNEHKYELLQLMNEVLRMEYIRRFLDTKNDPKDDNLKFLLHNFDLN